MKRTTGNIYSHVVIIGNGFDLNLGLKTGYCDFLQSHEFAVLLAKNNSLAEYLKTQHSLRNWIDIEIELTVYSKAQKEVNDVFKTEFRLLCSALMDYLNNLDYSDIDKNSHAYSLMKKISKENFLILDFNYTPTIENILIDLGVARELIDERLIKVHGCLKKKQIVFGVEDGANIKGEHVFLKKAYNECFEGIDIKYELDLMSQLFIFGHSLGRTDHTYFENFFQERSLPAIGNSPKKIHFYHYGVVGYDQLFMQLDVLTSRRLTGLKQVNEFIPIDSSKPMIETLKVLTEEAFN